jgi:hypothetical protein
VTFTTAEGRQQILDALGQAADHLSAALAQLSAAYELLDEHTAETLEDSLFGPVKRAYGRTRRAHEGFAQRHELAARAFETAPPAVPSHGAHELIDTAAELVGACDAELAELQDSLLPIEVGDPPLRADIEEARRQLGDYAAHTRALLRTLGR